MGATHPEWIHQENHRFGDLILCHRNDGLKCGDDLHHLSKESEANTWNQVAISCHADKEHAEVFQLRGYNS